MKQIVSFILAIALLYCGMAFAEDVTSQIDYKAMQWYEQATNDAFKRNGHPLTMSVSNDNGAYSLAANYWTQNGAAVTIEEALTSETLPVALMVSYSSLNNSIAFVFGSKTISEIPLSVEMYADGMRIQGGVLTPPEGANPGTSISGFYFDIATVHQILMSQDVFMRLVTDKGTSFIEVSGNNMLLPYCMLGLVCNGAEYSWMASPYYLDKTQLWNEIQNWQPQNVAPQQTALPAQTKSFQTDYEAIDKAAQSAFLLEVYDNKDQAIATGSGFVAFDKGTMITNEHVIEGAAYIIAYSDQYRNTYKLTELKAVDKEKDIAILAFDETANVQPLKVDGATRLLRGQPVTAIGSPKGILNTVSSGNISNTYSWSAAVPDAIQFTAPISPGSSGGALFNEQGSVVGLCVGYRADAEAVYVAIPIKYVEELYKASQSTATTTLRSYNGLDFGAPKLTIGAHGVILEWETVPGSTEYIIYRKTEDQGASFKEIARIAKPGTLDSSAKKGMTYEYYIEAHKGDEILRSGIAKITRPAPAATPTPIAGKFAAPELTVSNGGVYVRWDAVPKASGYIVYRRVADGQEDFKTLAMANLTSYLDTSAQKDVTYEYRIGAKLGTGISMSRPSRITYADSAATATPKPTAPSLSIGANVKANKGQYTISWTGGTAPYRITWKPADGKGETFSDSGISNKSYTTAWMIPGCRYSVTITDAKNKSVTKALTVPTASTFRDGTLTAAKIGIQISPRYDADGLKGSGGSVYVQHLYASDMVAGIKKGAAYGLYYRIDLPSFSGERTWMQTVVFRAPNGYRYIWYADYDNYTFPGAESWWKWDCMGREFFQEVYNTYRSIPKGQYYIDMYWNGMLVKSTAFQVKQ